MTTSERPPTVASAQLICAAILLMPLVYMGAAVALRLVGSLPPEGFGAFDPGMVPLLTGAFLAAAVGSGLASMLLRKVLAGSATDLSSRFRAAMVAMALSESGAVLGLLLMLLSGQVLYGALLCGLSFAITCFHFPTRSWLAHGDDPQ